MSSREETSFDRISSAWRAIPANASSVASKGGTLAPVLANGPGQHPERGLARVVIAQEPDGREQIGSRRVVVPQIEVPVVRDPERPGGRPDRRERRLELARLRASERRGWWRIRSRSPRARPVGRGRPAACSSGGEAPARRSSPPRPSARGSRPRPDQAGVDLRAPTKSTPAGMAAPARPSLFQKDRSALGR